jgi:hypothetical protein
MITLSTKSWHYRFAKFGINRHDVSTNLCPYVRQIIWGLFKFVALFMALAFYTTGLILAAAIWWTLGFDAMFHIGQAGMPGLALWVIIPTSVTAAVAILAVCAGYFAAKEKLQQRFRDKYIAEHGIEAWDMYRYGEKPKKEPNIITEWFKAKHEKICPQLTFKESEN